MRLRYGAGDFGGRGSRGGWAFDYPAMERNFMTVLNDLTTIRPHVRQSNVHDMDDPGLTRYAVAYLSEPGYWSPTPDEAKGLRERLLKGGFLIVDDFFGRQWEQFDRAMHAVLPEARIVPLDVSHPVFHSFFDIRTLEGMQPPAEPWQALAAALAVLAVVLGVTQFLLRPPRERQWTQQDVQRAELQVRWVIAHLGEVGRQAGEVVRKDVLEERVAVPTARADRTGAARGARQSERSLGGHR